VGSEHFHFYRLLGVLPMALALMFHARPQRARRRTPAATGWGRLLSRLAV
jgi:hypothetical protein